MSDYVCHDIERHIGYVQHKRVYKNWQFLERTCFHMYNLWYLNKLINIGMRSLDGNKHVSITLLYKNMYTFAL